MSGLFSFRSWSLVFTVYCGVCVNVVHRSISVTCNFGISVRLPNGNIVGLAFHVTSTSILTGFSCNAVSQSQLTSCGNVRRWRNFDRLHWPRQILVVDVFESVATRAALLDK